MGSKKHLGILLQGAAVVAPAIITLYICIAAIWWLDKLVRSGMGYVGLRPLPGLGFVLALVTIYLIGLLTRIWLFRKLVGVGEALVSRVPLVKSLYSAIKDMLKLVGGGEPASRGTPARLKLLDGQVHLLGILTQRNPEQQVGEAERGRVGVYLPMSLQIGGFTLYVPQESVEEIEGMDVETVMKLSMTAGVGTPKPARRAPE